MNANRFRVVDPELAASLAESGAAVDETAPEVEIVSEADDLRGDAAVAVVTVDPRTPTGGPLAVRAARRLTTSLRTRARVADVRRALVRRGYDEVSVLLWDAAHPTRLAGVPMARRKLAERLPGRAIVIGYRGSHGPSALEAGLAAAARECGHELRPEWASIRSGTLIVAADGVLFRTTIGHARLQIVNQIVALETLGRMEIPACVAERVPWLLGHGRAGLADWSLERRLPGVRPAHTLMPELLEQCVDFLIGLHGIRSPERDEGRLVDLAETVAGVCRPESEAVVRALAERLEQNLSDVPRGFGHGDFFAGNLLTAADGLTGVVDWDAAGRDRLPLLDLFHLELTRSGYGRDEGWGGALLGHLLPLAQGGGGPVLGRYCRELGFDAGLPLLEALVSAYWLEYAGYQLRTHGDRRHQPGWIERNVELVLGEIASLTGNR